MKQYLYLFFFLVMLGCKDSESLVLEPFLEDYITSNEVFPLVRDSLIACAFGSDSKLMADDDFPLSILFYPEGNATDFRYFETESADIDPEDLSQYCRKDLPHSPIFNGYLRRFERAALDKNIWARVSYIKDGNLHISNAIRLKYNDKPSETNPSLLTIDQSENLSPIFSWLDGVIPENAIYFHAVLDSNNDLISGTYSFDRQFQFYDLSNVVLNIRAINPPPTLQQNEEYTFVLMGVSLDNWVNLFIEQPFTTTD